MQKLLMMIALLSVALLAQRPSANYTGTWKAQLATSTGKTENIIVLRTAGEKVTGTVKNNAGEFPVQNGSVEGEDVFFTVMVKNVKLTYRGHMFANDEIQFKVESGDDTYDMVAQREP